MQVFKTCLFNFFHQCFVVFSVQFLCIFSVQSVSKVSSAFSFWCYCKWNCLLNFLLSFLFLKQILFIFRVCVSVAFRVRWFKNLSIWKFTMGNISWNFFICSGKLWGFYLWNDSLHHKKISFCIYKIFFCYLKKCLITDAVFLFLTLHILCFLLVLKVTVSI